jgi:hypothetical protein
MKDKYQESFCCWEIRHHQPYLYEIDWYGVAGVIHALLFKETMKIEEEEEEEEENEDENENENTTENNNYGSHQKNETYTIYDYSNQDHENLTQKVISSSTYSSSSSPSLSSSSSPFNKKKPHLRISKTFKRYWQKELWQRLFDVLLNAKTVNSSHLNLSLALDSYSSLLTSTLSSTSTPTSASITSTSSSSPSTYYEQRFPKIREIREIRHSFETWLSQHDHSSQYHLYGYLRLLSAQCIAMNKF